MKKILFFIFVLAFFYIGSGVYNNKTSLTYVESSSGLNLLFEGGRSELEFADMNGDGFKDIISVGDHGNPHIQADEEGIMVWLGNGTGANWVYHQMGDLGYGGIAAGDVNNDGKMDVGYGIHHNYSSNDLGNQIFEVAIGDGSGMNWTAWDDGLATNGETWGMFSTDFGDIDNDGLLDVGSISFGCCAGVHVYKNLGTGTWQQTFGWVGGNSSMEFLFADFNNDGNLDFTTAHQNGVVFFGNGLGGFTNMQSNLPVPGTTGHRGNSTGDVNNDGAADLSFIAAGGAVNVWKWNKTSSQWDNMSGNLPASSSFSRTSLYDMNRDGFTDIVLYGNGYIKIYSGNGGTNWTEINTITIPTGGYGGMAVGDADNNGYPDITILNRESTNKLRFFKENTPFDSLSISPLYPRGGEVFKSGQIKFIDWISSVPQNSTSKVKLEFSTNGTGGPWTTIADSIPNSGRYQWTVPQGIGSLNCFIKYTLLNSTGTITGINNNPFVIDLVSNLNNGAEEIKEFKLEQNYPNPFNSSSNIKFKTPLCHSGESRNPLVSIKVYDLLGKEVRTLVNEVLQPGEYSIRFDAGDLPSGIYFYTLKAGDFAETKRMILLK